MRTNQIVNLFRRAILRFELYNHTQSIAAQSLGDITVNCNRSDCKRGDKGTRPGRNVFIGKGRVTVYLEKGTPVAITHRRRF